MPSSQLKRAEHSVAAIRQADMAPETAAAVEEIVAAIRTVERRLELLEKRNRLPADTLPSPRRRGREQTSSQ